MSRRKSTTTSDFGSPGRSSHDSSKFYSGRLYDGLEQQEIEEYSEFPLPIELTNRIFCKSSESMDELANASIHLMVTSPPYNVGKHYDENLNIDEYRSFIKQVMGEVYRVLVPGGRVCLNLANLGRKPYIPLESYITEDMISLGFLMRGQVIWDKASSAGGSTAWGSWTSAANPTLRDIHEYILIFSKETFSRPKPPGRHSTITKEDFLECTKSIWRFPSESAKRIGHPAPFPVELARRCIELYTYHNEIVLDPFMGSGSTALAAVKCERRFIGYEIDRDYIDLSERRLNQNKVNKTFTT
jgi:DNA modification methylase